MSLLKRIEQGNSGPPAAAPAREGGAPAQPPAEGASPSASTARLSGLSTRRVSAPGADQRDPDQGLKSRVQNKLLGELDPSMDVTQTAEVRRTIEELFETILAEEKIVLSRPERRRLFEPTPEACAARVKRRLSSEHGPPCNRFLVSEASRGPRPLRLAFVGQRRTTY